MLGKDRLITAAVALPLVGAAVAWLPSALFAVLIAAVSAAGMWELYRFRFPGGLTTAAWIAVVAGFFVVAAAPLHWQLLAPAVLLVLVARLASGRVADALGDCGALVLGLVWVALLLSHVPLLHAAADGAEGGGFRWVFFLMLVTWSGDAAAYYTGRTIGRRRLTTVSPNKTVEGTLGGVLASIAAAYLGSLFVPGLSPLDPLAIGLLLGVLALLGDLVESLFKREAGVKDSSNLIPAHGGVLDKLDAFLFTGTGLYYYLAWMVWVRPPVP
ncbi:MAG: phosphatidate cytidylyltransferase [Nitrospirota bacterium]|nr:phosphatidate cytidylyltransferase [Nitrospirota bacterium]